RHTRSKRDWSSDVCSSDLIFHAFMDYMGDEEKDGELFTNTKDTLDEREEKHVKEMFELAQKNGSPMWQDVISFDNDWLEEQGLYDLETHKINEEKIRQEKRSAVKEIF